jgi:hypothetical protein
VFDNSASVTGGNDPIGNRYVEARIALEAVGRRCRCRRELGAVLHFDTPTSGDVSPTPIYGRHRARLLEGLAAPPDGRGCSLLAPSLDVARRIASAHPDHLTVLMVFSDFQLFDPNLDQLYGELGAFPGAVHAVVLRARPPQPLMNDPRITVIPVDYDSPPGTVARALFDALTTHRPKRRWASPTGSWRS